MKIKIKRFDKSLPMPEYKTSGAAGFDLYVRNDEIVKSKALALLPCNLGVAVPKGYFLQITGRSSTPAKFGLLVFTGVVDPDYCGNEDEMKISVYNFTENDIEIKKGMRIAQGILIKIARADFKEVSKMKSVSRGGFGTTGR